MQMKIHLSLHVLREVVQLFHFGCQHPFETRITSNLVDQPDSRVIPFPPPIQWYPQSTQ